MRLVEIANETLEKKKFNTGVQVNYFKLINIRRKINNEIILYYLFDILLLLNIFFFFINVKIKQKVSNKKAIK